MTFPKAYEGYTIQSVVVTKLLCRMSWNLENDQIMPTSTPITITDGETTIASNKATVRFNAFYTHRNTFAATAYIKGSEGDIVALREEITADEYVDFLPGLHHTLDCENMAVVTTSWADNASEDAFEGGDSVDDPIEISTAAQLAKLAEDVNENNLYSGKFFELTADIDLSAHEWVSIGYKYSIYDRPFTSTFDGGGHKVSGLYINQSEVDYQGLFGYISGATIKNLSVSGYVKGDSFVGGIVGAAYTPYSPTPYYYSIINCHSSCSVEGKDRVGGVVGTSISNGSANISISNCYNNGSVKGTTDYVGGVVGNASAPGSASTSVANCYNSGNVNGSGNVGGVLGYGTSVSVTNCYYLDSTATQGVGNAPGATGVTAETAILMKSSTFLITLNNNAKDLNSTTDTACEWKSGAEGFPTLNFGVYSRNE